MRGRPRGSFDKVLSASSCRFPNYPSCRSCRDFRTCRCCPGSRTDCFPTSGCRSSHRTRNSSPTSRSYRPTTSSSRTNRSCRRACWSCQCPRRSGCHDQCGFRTSCCPSSSRPIFRTDSDRSIPSSTQRTRSDCSSRDCSCSTTGSTDWTSSRCWSCRSAIRDCPTRTRSCRRCPRCSTSRANHSDRSGDLPYNLLPRF